MKTCLKVFLFIALFSSGLLGFPRFSSSREVQVWTNLGLYGGQIYDIAIDPSNPDKMFAGSYMGSGLFVTTDGGSGWQAVVAAEEIEGEDTFKNHAVWAVKIAPGNPNVIWAAHNYWVEKSTDGGQTWTHIWNGWMQSPNYGTCPNCPIWDQYRWCLSLAVDPSDPEGNTVFVGTSGRYSNWTPYGAIYMTEDGGDTWRKLKGPVYDEPGDYTDPEDPGNFDYDVVDLSIDTSNPDIIVIWAVTSNGGVFVDQAVSGEKISDGTLYRGEINRLTGAETWTEVFSMYGGEFYDVEVKPDDPNSIFTANDWGIFRHYNEGGDWKYQWILNMNGDTPTDNEVFARHVRALAFDPKNPDILYASWKNYYSKWTNVDTSSKIGRHRTPDIGNSTWEDSEWDIYTVKYLFLGLTVHPENNEVIFGGELNQGVYKSQDHCNIWMPVNNGINAVQINEVQVDTYDTAHLLAATQIGVYEKRGAGEWINTSDFEYPDVSSVEFDPTDASGSTYYAGARDYLAKTTNGGQDWTFSNALPTSYLVDIAVGLDGNTVFVTTHTVGGASSIRGVYKSENGLATPTLTRVLSSDEFNFNVVVIDPNDPDHIFAGSGDYGGTKVLGNLYESTTGGNAGTWQLTGLTDVIVNSLLIDPRDSDIMYVGCGWSGGTDVPVYKSMDGGATWTPSFEGIPGMILPVRDIWGASPTDVFAVGEVAATSNAALIFHYDGSTWTNMDSATIQGLRSVWGTSTTHVFAVGNNGTILHYDGSNWSAMNSGTSERILDVWGSTQNNVFAVGNNGAILNYNGSAWTTMNSGTTENLWGVWGGSATDAFAVGDNGTILHYTGDVWAAMNSGTTESLLGVWEASTSNAFAVGGNGTILHYNGNTWNEMSSGTTKDLEGVWGASATDVFAVGDDGAILHYDGRDWTKMDSGITEYIYSVWGSSGTDVFAVGGEGTIVHFDGESWAVTKSGGKNWNSVTDLEFHRENKDVIYASTSQQGVYVSPNNAQNWLNFGTPEFIVKTISTSSLYAGTEGGLFQCTGTGVIAGNVIDAPTGSGIDNASIHTDLGDECTSVAGEYMMVCPSGIFDVTVIADDHANRTIKDVTVLGGDVSWSNFSMPPGTSVPWVPPGSSNSSSGGGSYCFIATAAYGSPLEKPVEILRRFRDSYLLPYAMGRKLVALYYRTGKPAARYIRSHPWLKPPVRALLYPAVGLAWLAVSTSAKTKGVMCLCVFIFGMGLIRLHKTKTKGGKRSAPGHGIDLMLILMVSMLVFEAPPVQAATLFQSVGIASSPNPVGSGARAVGMGGAFIGVADDATAASWNPAGLIQLERPELSIVTDYNYRKEEFSSGRHPEIDNTGDVDEVELNYFSAAYPFHFYRNMVVSINYQRLYDFNRSFDYRYDYSSAGLDLEQHKDFSQDGYVGALGLAAAVEITPDFSLGATLNIWTDQLLWENKWRENFTEHGVGTLGGVPITIDTRIHDKYYQFRGVNANLGLLWKITRNLTMGAVVKTPFTADLRHEFGSEQTQTIGGSTTVFPSIYQKEDVELDMPWSYGIGFAWRFSDAFSIDMDVYRTDWSEYILTDDQGNEFSPIDGRPKHQSHVKDTTQVRIGGEYLFIRQKKNMVIPIRAGFFYDPEPSEGSPEDFYGFAVGSGIAYNGFIFDVAYQFRWGNDVDTGNLISTSEADITQHTFLTSIIVHF